MLGSSGAKSASTPLDRSVALLLKCSVVPAFGQPGDLPLCHSASSVLGRSSARSFEPLRHWLNLAFGASGARPLRSATLGSYDTRPPRPVLRSVLRRSGAQWLSLLRCSAAPMLGCSVRSFPELFRPGARPFLHSAISGVHVLVFSMCPVHRSSAARPLRRSNDNCFRARLVQRLSSIPIHSL